MILPFGNANNLGGLSQRFDFTLVPDQKIEMEPLVTLRPKYGIQMMLN